MDPGEFNEGCSSNSGGKRTATEAFGDDSDCDSDFMLPSDDEEEEDNSRVVTVPVRTNPIFGFQIMLPTVSVKSLQKRTVCLNCKLNSQVFKDHFREDWCANKLIIADTHEIMTNPFKICILNNVLEDDSILRYVRQEFYELDWNRRRMDLYDFHQSRDLQHIKTENISAVYCFLKEIMMPWVAKTMCYDLKTISATCSFYTDTDYLLVHDDQRGDRIVAFVFYFSDVVNWDPAWGGALQLLSSTEKKQPDKPSRSINPVNNQLVLFPVTSTSYHQVEEVTQKNFCRYSINGWFHGTVKHPADTPVYNPPEKGLYSDSYVGYEQACVELPEWISEDYLAQYHIEDIQGHIEEHSEISLPNYFLRSKYSDVCKALRNKTLKWELVGPPNRYRYETLPEDQYPRCVKELVNLFKSESMFKLMKCYTELDLDEENAGVKFEVQRWGPGHYSLLSDYDWHKRKELDVVAYFCCENVVGGQTQYVSEDEEVQHALVTLAPENNTLNIVFRDTARITGYVSKYTSQPFYVLFCSYTENKD